MRVSKGKKEAIIHYEVSSRFDLKLNELEKSYRDEIEKEVLKTIPAKVMKVHEDGWCNSSSSVNIDGFENKVNRRSDIYVCTDISSYLPIKRNDYRHNINLTKTLKNKLEKYREFKKEKKIFRDKLKRALMPLTTSKQILEHLPELKEHFADEIRSKAIIPLEQIKEVRDLLKIKKPKKVENG